MIANDYRHRHSDHVTGKNRIAAHVLNLTPRLSVTGWLRHRQRCCRGAFPGSWEMGR